MNQLSAVTLSAVTTVFIFLLDVNIPLGVAVGALYVIPLVTTIWIAASWYPLALGFAGSALIILGVPMSPPSELVWIVASNRVISLLVLWAAALVAFLYKRSEAELRLAGGALEIKVASRTIDLEKALESARVAAEWSRQSEERLKAIINNSSAIIYLKDREGKYLLTNREFDLLFNLAPGQAMGHTDFDFSPPEMAAAFQENDRATAARGESMAFEEIAPSREGTRVYVSVKFPVFDHWGEVIAVGGISTDITERKLADERLRESERKLAEAQRIAHLGSWDLDLRSGALRFSDEMYRIYGWNPETDQVTLDAFFKALHPDDRAILERLEQADFNRQPFHEIELRITRPDGQARDIFSAFNVIRDEFDMPARLVGINLDITERKRVERRLRERENWYQNILDTVTDGIYILDAAGRIAFANAAAANNFFGLSLAELYDRTYNDPRWDMRKPDGSPMGEDDYMFTKIRESGKPVYGVEYVVSAGPHGRRQITSVNAAPIFGPAGEFQGMVATQQDVTERRAAEAATRRAHKENERLIRAISSILIQADENDVVIRWNAEAEKAFNIEAESAAGARFLGLDIRWDWLQVAEQIALCRERREMRRMIDVRFHHNHGKERFLDFTVTPIFNEDQSWGGFLFLGVDVTERKLLEAQLAQAQKLESIGQLAASIAHEINTPIQYVGHNARFLSESFGGLLRVIDAYTDTVKGNCACRTAGSLEAVDRIIRDVDLDFLRDEIPLAIQQSLDGIGKVATIVRAMKEFSHPGSEEKTPTDINHAIENTVAVSRNEWKYIAELKTNLDPSLPLVPCLPSEFNQVVLNLIVNAAHAIEDKLGRGGKEKGAITVSTSREGAALRIDISDSGKGIPPEIHHKIFDPFFTTKDVGRGTGQGLAIARSVIVDKHQGEISFATVPGEGTTFTILLPMGGAGLPET